MIRTIVLALAAGMIAVGCVRGAEERRIVIRDEVEYNEALGEARALSERHVKAFAAGESLAENDVSDLRRAARLFDALIDYQPTFFALHFGSGQIEHALGNAARARLRFRQAVALAPKPESVETMVIVADAEYGLSQIEFFAKNYSAAERHIRAAIERFPDHAGYWTALASIQIECRDLKGARDSIARGLRIDPGNRRALQLRRLLRAERS